MASGGELHGWHPDPFGRFEERYFIEGEPSHLVRTNGTEASDTSASMSPSSGEKSPTGTHNANAAEAHCIVATSDGASQQDSVQGDVPYNAPTHFTSVAPQRSKVHTMRIIWGVLAALCAVAAIVFLNLHVTAAVTSDNGVRTVNYNCGSVMSPQAVPGDGIGFLNQDSECSSARHSNQIHVIWFGGLAVVFMLLAGSAMVADAQRASANDRGHWVAEVHEHADEDQQRPLSLREMVSDSVHNRTYTRSPQLDK